jgi:hypothetical protein
MTRQATPAPPTVPENLLEQYDLEDEVGRSARACVYRARDRVLDQTVALKLLHPRYGADAAFASRLYLTARAAAALGHPAIAAVYDRGPFDGSTFITSEWLAGGNLAALLHTSGPLTARQAVPALARVLDALAVAHASGIVHGDLHPRNLLLRGTEGRGALALADFGMNFVREWSEGRDGTIGDAVAPYRAPEAQPGAAATVAADLYAVAAILYEILAGGHAPSGGVWRRPAAIPRPLFATLERALSPDPGARYPSAIALRDALAAAIGATVPASWVAAPAGQLEEAVRVTGRTGATATARPWRSPRTAALLVTGALALGGLTGTAAFVQAGAPGFPRRAPLATVSPTAAVAPDTEALPTVAVTPDTEASPSPAPVPVVVPTPTFAAPEPTATSAAAIPSPVATLSAGAAALAPAQGSAPPARYTPPPRPSTSPAPTVTVAPPRVVSSGGVVGVTLENFSPSLLAGAYQPLDDQRRDGAQVALYGAGSGYNVGILTFESTVAPIGPLTLVLTGLDDEQAGHSTIQILLNGTTLYAGPSGFDNRPAIGAATGGTLPWEQMRLIIPAGTLKLGPNSLVVRNTTAGDELAPPYVLIHDMQIVGEAP